MRSPDDQRLAARATRLCLDHPWSVTGLMLSSTLLLLVLAALPTIWPERFAPLHPAAIDTDPENMLPADEPVRVAHNRSKRLFSLHDGIGIGIINTQHPQGVWNPVTLGKLHALTEHAKSLDTVVQVDLLSASTVDSIRPDGPGQVRFEWLMAEPPKTQTEADAIRARALRIPFLRGTLASADGQGVALFLPLTDKHEAHEVSLAMQAHIDALQAERGAGGDVFHIGGLPVAEDTFGVEMFKQMALSAPLAMLVIFLLMFLFFRKLRVIVAPMVVAMVSALSTMGLLVVSGQTIHIMSSMIPIFIMPIAVLDAIHIISDFFDRYPQYRDRRKTIEAVMSHLFSPMLFTSLTTTAGFASLALTPIPPVQVFGVFVAFGVLAAWFWTITFIPAYVMLIPEERLANFGRQSTQDDAPDAWGLRLAALTQRRARLVAAGALLLGALAAFGISTIEVNDNPTRWFEPSHPIRIADREMNAHFGGSYNAYLHLRAARSDYAPAEEARALKAELEGLEAELVQVAGRIEEMLARSAGQAPFPRLDALEADIRKARKATPAEAWKAAQPLLDNALAAAEEAEDAGKAANFEGLFAAWKQRHLEHLAALPAALDAVAAQAPEDRAAFAAAIQRSTRDAPPFIHDVIGGLAQRGEVFKRPALLRYLAELQSAVQDSGLAGKSSSVADIVKTVHRDLLSGEEADYRIPDRKDAVAQTLDQYTSSHRKDDLWHFVTPDFTQAVIWLQLRSGDNRDMQALAEFVDRWVKAHPAPVSIEAPTWFGLTYINVVWQQKMVRGMLEAFAGSFIVVLLMMAFLFRSLWWGLLSMLPLTLTVGLIYGLTGLLGKDYDMPVAVLSSLSLGMAIDYAIHFLARSRQLHAELGCWDAARRAVFGEPARAIGRNVIVVGVGFLPLLLAPLVPYQTVGLLIASILLLAGAATLLLLPALITLLEPRLFGAAPEVSQGAHP